MAVEQARRRPALDLGSEFPSKVRGVVEACAQSRTTSRQLNMRGVTGEQHTSFPVGIRLTAGVGESGQPAGFSHRHVASRGSANAVAQFVERHGHFAIEALRIGLDGDHAKVAVIQRREWRPASLPPGGVVAKLAELHVAESKQSRWTGAGESDASHFADDAPSAVATDDEPGVEPSFLVRTTNVQLNALAVLLETDHFVTATHFDAEFV